MPKISHIQKEAIISMIVILGCSKINIEISYVGMETIEFSEYRELCNMARLPVLNQLHQKAI